MASWKPSTICPMRSQHGSLQSRQEFGLDGNGSTRTLNGDQQSRRAKLKPSLVRVLAHRAVSYLALVLCLIQEHERRTHERSV